MYLYFMILCELLKKSTLLIGFKLDHCRWFVHPLNIMIRSWIEFWFCISLLNSEKLTLRGTQIPITRSWIIHGFLKVNFDWIQTHTRFDVVSTNRKFWIVNRWSNLVVIIFRIATEKLNVTNMYNVKYNWTEHVWCSRCADF